MKKLIYIIAFLISLAFISCLNRGYKEARITHRDAVKVVEVNFGIDAGIIDTTFSVPASIPDSAILKRLRIIEDSLIYEKFKKDSLYAIFQRDSVYLEFQIDSINFRKITKIINGGYNGWEERYRLWINAREVIKNHNNTVKK